MKKLTKVIMSGAAVAALGASMAFGFAACGNGNSEGGITEFAIEGSTSMEEVMNHLIEAFQDKYYEENGVEITITPTYSGSGSGIQAAQDGRVAFGLASRALSDEESKVLESETICLDGIAVVVNPNCTLENVTKQDLINIYTVEGTTLGSVVRALRRESGSGTRSGFQEILGIEDEDLIQSEGFNQYDGTGALKEAIVQDEAATAIGYISMASVDSTVKALNYEGVKPTTENVKSGDYALQHPFVICYQDYDALDGLVKEFIEFIRSDEGQQICEEEGGISETL